jgi:beta-lactamase class A
VSRGTASQPLSDLFDRAGVQGFVHAREVNGVRELGHGADEPVATASTFKLLVLVELFRRADAAELDLREPVDVPVSGRTMGPTGISALMDPVRMSWRDLAAGMIAVSDNAATDVILERLGRDNVNATARELGLDSTHVVTDCAGIGDSMVEDAGVTTLTELFPSPPAHVLPHLRAEDPSLANRSTARDMTRLLCLVWTDAAATPGSCAAMRALLRQQVWPHRLASGFPEDDMVTAGKTGTLFSWRSEVGVAESPEGFHCAVAVYVRLPPPYGKRPDVDRLIGSAARLAVDTLRGRRS